MDNSGIQSQDKMNQFDGLDEVFEVTSDIVKESSAAEIVEPPKKESDIKDDYEYSRAQLYTLISKGQEAVQGALELAQQSDHPRAYEVAGQLIKSVGDVTDKLIDLQKKVNEIENPKKGNQPQNVTNALFVGSTSELAKLLKQQKQSLDK
jgi:hypothetical protein